VVWSTCRRSWGRSVEQTLEEPPEPGLGRSEQRRGRSKQRRSRAEQGRGSLAGRSGARSGDDF
jgi:hypothetical protein